MYNTTPIPSFAQYLEFLEEKRKHPHLNKREIEIDTILQYENDPNAYITFTTIRKFGINPTNKFKTPIGIYAYPIKYSIDHYNIHKYGISNLPFATDRPYIWVFRAKQPSLIMNMEEYGEGDLEQDMDRLRSANLPHISQEELSTEIAYAMYRRDSAVPAKQLWDILRRIAKNTTNWTKILYQDLGYHGIVDPKYGIIHPEEPCQAVFFNTTNLQPKHLIIRPKSNINYSSEFDMMDYAGLYIHSLVKLIPSKFSPTFESDYKIAQLFPSHLVFGGVKVTVWGTPYLLAFTKGNELNRCSLHIFNWKKQTQIQEYRNVAHYKSHREFTRSVKVALDYLLTLTPNRSTSYY